VCSSCSAPDNSGWARAEAQSYEVFVDETSTPTTAYTIAWIDASFTRCVQLWVAKPSGFDEPSGVAVPGTDLDVRYARVSDNVERCRPEFVTQGVERISGKLEFDDPDDPCFVSFDLELHPFEGGSLGSEVVEAAARDVPILAEGCRPPIPAPVSLTDLSAAYGTVNGVANLVVAGWEPEREVCAWARLLDGDSLPSAPSSDVDAPAPWVYTGLRFGLSERDACLAENFVVPPVGPDYANDSAPVLDSTGSIEIRAGSDELPCEIDVALTLDSYGSYWWTPLVVELSGDAIAVTDACG